VAAQAEPAIKLVFAKRRNEKERNAPWMTTSTCWRSQVSWHSVPRARRSLTCEKSRASRNIRSGLLPYMAGEAGGSAQVCSCINVIRPENCSISAKCRSNCN